MLQKRIAVVVLTGLLGLFLVQCKKKPGNEDLNPDASFDKAALLANVGENIIMPAYADLKLSINNLSETTDTFVKNPTTQYLQKIQSAFIDAYLRYESVSSFEFGPADAEILRASFNIFPCDTIKINSKIIAANFDFSTVSDMDVKGFPAIDFLLFNRTPNDNAILSRFTTAANAGNTKLYLRALVNELKHKIDAVNTGWSLGGGNYITKFKSSLGSSVGSSLGLLVNQFNYDYENLKNARIGIPLGKKSMGAVFPDKVEAFYSGKSLLLAMEQIKSIENIYLGRDVKGNDGLGFDDYLAALKAQHPLGPLNEVIRNKIDSAKNELIKLQHENFSELIKTNPAQVEAAYLQIYQLTVLIKVDMPSAFGVMITYEDNDGD